MQEKFRVLITTKLFGIVSDEPIKMLEEAGCEVIKSTLRHPIGPGDFATLVNGIDAAIVGNDTVDKAAIDAADRLKVICMHGVGHRCHRCGCSKAEGNSGPEPSRRQC